ncbi:hypothetical protein JJD41_05885 [Oxynema sp. CENA135]|uniref:hypothetical protein n=1 Tax=Oxynema sp. CENA135 TaxID=984206 RepID=UPI00190C5B2D|nr:hypothetical protein [Oxynema sp. CENA135]MBK4729417.1 hypothetical protein [Oxynema sp. CENA135]
MNTEGNKHHWIVIVPSQAKRSIAAVEPIELKKRRWLDRWQSAWEWLVLGCLQAIARQSAKERDADRLSGATTVGGTGRSRENPKRSRSDRGFSEAE